MTDKEWKDLVELARDRGYLVLECDEENESALIRAGYKGGAGTFGLRPQYGLEEWTSYPSVEALKAAIIKEPSESLTPDGIENRLRGMRDELTDMITWARAHVTYLGRHDVKRLDAAMIAVGRAWSLWRHDVE